VSLISKKYKLIKNPILWGALVTILFVVLIYSYGSQSTCINIDKKSENCTSNFKIFWNSPPHSFGDTLAGIAGALALLWIIVTVALQRQQLNAQRQELEFTRKEIMKGNDAFNKQMFENSFFSMLKTYNSIVESVDIDNTNISILDLVERTNVPKDIRTGKDAFAVILERLMSEFDDVKEVSVSETSEEEIIFQAYAEFWDGYQNELGHYFRFLYRFFLILKESELSETKHVKILRGFLSDQELALIFYNCLYPRGENFKSLAIEFSLFDNLSPKMLANPLHKNLIHPKAFDSSYPMEGGTQ